MSGLAQGWVTTSLANLGEPDQQTVLTGPFGANLGKEDFIARGIPVFTIGCLATDAINRTKLLYVSPEKAQGLSAYRLREGDFLFSRMASVGRVGFVPPDLEGALFNYHLMRLRLDGELLLPRFFYFFVRGAEQVGTYLDEVSRGATRDGINTKLLLNMPVNVPPLPEQRRIVAKIDSLTGKSRRARDHLDHIPRLVEKYKHAVLAAAFNPEAMAGWQGTQLEGVVADALIGLVRGKSEQSASHGVPYIRMNHYDLAGRWNEDDLTLVAADAKEIARYELREGDLLFNTRNSLELVGKVALWGKRPSGYLYNNNLLRLRFRPEIVPTFAFYQMISPQFRSYLHSVKSATTSVCAIYQRSIMAAPWAYPETNRQLEIANWIEAAFAKIDRLASEATSARRLIDRLDQAVLAKAFRGELVPQDPEDEPAGVLLERIRAGRGAAPRAKRGQKAKG